MTENDQKKAFAIALLSDPKDPFACAQSVFGDNVGRALEIQNIWPKDLKVKEYQAEYIKANGAEVGLPTKENYAQDVYNLAKDKGIDDEVRLKFYKLYGDIRGFIEKPGMTVNTNTNIDNRKVIVVKDHGTDEEWETKLRAQQKKLVADND
jgi:hypothetical protein